MKNNKPKTIEGEQRMNLESEIERRLDYRGSSDDDAIGSFIRLFRRFGNELIGEDLEDQHIDQRIASPKQKWWWWGWEAGVNNSKKEQRSRLEEMLKGGKE